MSISKFEIRMKEGTAMLHIHDSSVAKSENGFLFCVSLSVAMTEVCHPAVVCDKWVSCPKLVCSSSYICEAPDRPLPSAK